MKLIERFAEIDAPPEVVWEVLVAFDAYPEWNPFVTSIEGEPVKGERLRVRLEPPGARPTTFEPEVVAAQENRRLAWRGQLGVPFVFDGYHEFHLEPVDGGERTRLLHRETFRGALVGVLLDEERVTAGFDEMNEALAERAETRVNAVA